MRTIIAALICVCGGMLAGCGSRDRGEVMRYGDLLPGFVDRDGDLVADAPIDSRDWIDSPTLIFSYTPVEDPEVYRGVWDDFVDHIAKITGKQVRFYPVQNYAAQLEALRAGRLHIAGVNTGNIPMAVNTAGFVPFAMMASKDGGYGYEMEIITHVDSDIRTIADLKGKTLAFVTQTSNSGFKAPSALLKGEFGLVADQDYTTAFSGKHDNSILGVANKDYDAGAIANSVLARMIARHAVDPSKFRTLYKSQTFPTTGYGHAHNLKPELAEKIREAFFSFPWEGTKLEEEFGKNGEGQFIPITYKEHWEVIRTIDRASGVVYQ